MIRFCALGPQHDRASFRNGVDSLDRYLRESATQAMRKRLSAVVVATDSGDPREILGYYALAATEIDGSRLPESVRRSERLPTHSIGTVILGRLAVDKRHQGRGIGGRLLANAFRRSIAAASLIGTTCVVVDALDERAARFYESFGFVRIRDSSRLVIAMQSIVAGSAG